MNTSSSWNSLVDSSIAVPARRTSRLAGSSTRSPTSSTVVAFDRPAPVERPQPRQQLVEVERLDEVVVGAGVEPGHAVGHAVAGREHEDRRAQAVLAQPAAGLEAVDLRQVDVEHDHVVAVGGGHPERVLAGHRDVGQQAAFAQALTDQLGELDLVFHYEDTHPPKDGEAELPRNALIVLSRG